MVWCLVELISKEGHKLSQPLILFLPLLSLAIVWLIEVQNSPLLLKVVIVKAVHRIEIVADQEHDAGPLEATWSLQAKDDHEYPELHQEHWLEDHVVAEKADRVIVFIQL